MKIWTGRQRRAEGVVVVVVEGEKQFNKDPCQQDLLVTFSALVAPSLDIIFPSCQDEGEVADEGEEEGVVLYLQWAFLLQIYNKCREKQLQCILQGDFQS
jgi:hypothetical protein